MTPIVLLPGMDGSGSLFSDFIAALKAQAIVISYPADRPLGYDELTHFVRDCLPKDQPFILLAESFSGPVAISLAATSPASLRALVLVCTFAKAPAPKLFSFLRHLVTYVPVWLAPASVAAKVLFGRFAPPNATARVAGIVKAVAPSVWRTRMRAALKVDLTEDVSRITVPSIYLRASEDAVVYRSASELISRHNSKIRVLEIQGPHFLLQAKPEEAAAVIRTFARELDITL